MSNSPAQQTLTLELTPEQKQKLEEFAKATGSKKLTASAEFEAAVDTGKISPATFLVGNAI
ncbi:hypothetical protein [Bradyrhizobium arachidis]|uniref:hypothetical protein n=1 Tax=Bradyrhizobium arachidis TaxID=858423 RepID=UPI0021637F3D|nr:hypothetical protein [Bradyrhizobium arachidis]UVO30146.1 hypothetical protein KUF59_05100 [Bradyrhizobium arachidis]